MHHGLDLVKCMKEKKRATSILCIETSDKSKDVYKLTKNDKPCGVLTAKMNKASLLLKSINGQTGKNNEKPNEFNGNNNENPSSISKKKEKKKHHKNNKPSGMNVMPIKLSVPITHEIKRKNKK
jgi:hypothetical protein